MIWKTNTRNYTGMHDTNNKDKVPKRQENRERRERKKRGSWDRDTQQPEECKTK